VVPDGQQAGGLGARVQVDRHLTGLLDGAQLAEHHVDHRV
jgi:hypothetical protein